MEIDGKEYLVLRLAYEIRSGWWGIGKIFESRSEAEEYREKIFPGKGFPPIKEIFVVVEPSEIATLLKSPQP